MSLPNTICLNQYIGIRIMLDQLSCFVQYADLHIKKAAKPEVVTFCCVIHGR